MKHINYRVNDAKPVAANVAHMAMSALFRTDAMYYVFKDEEAIKHITLGQVKSFKAKGKHLFHKDSKGVLRAVDIEDNKVVLRILHLKEIVYVMEEKVQ